MTPDERLASVHILHVDGRIDSAGMAIIDLASRLPFVGRAATLSGRNGPIRRVVEAGYRVVSRNRHRLAGFVRDVGPVVRWRVDP
jgi:hypothetical protein